MSEGMSKEGRGEVFSNLRAVGEGEDKREQSRNANKRQGNYLPKWKNVSGKRKGVSNYQENEGVSEYIFIPDLLAKFA